MRLKVNALTDEGVIAELYRAGRAGAEIEIVCRGICTLRPGAAGLSETIEVRSVLGRFLEHSRLFMFEAGDRTSTYLGSADLMQRNLDHRVEVVVPVEAEALQAELRDVFETLLADTQASWLLEPDGAWRRIRPAKGEKAVSAHEALMRRARRRAAHSRAR